MSKRVVRFEDLDAWQRSLELADGIYSQLEQAPLSRHFGLCNQMERAAVSVLSNIAEGFDRGSNRAFVYFLRVAKGSVAELRAQSYLAARRSLFTAETLSDLLALTDRASRILGGLIRYLKSIELQAATSNSRSDPVELKHVHPEETKYPAEPQRGALDTDAELHHRDSK